MAQKRFLNISDLLSLPKPQWLVEGMFEVSSLTMIAGPPGSLKSFLALDWLLSLALGKTWCNRRVVESKVLYVLGEGKASLLKRILAWGEFHQLGKNEQDKIDANFRVSFQVPQLATKISVDNMLADLSAEGFTPNLIVIDTFARSFVGLDENGQDDTGLWVESADRLRNLGYTVVVLHHTAKNTEFGVKYRGSTAIMGAMDTAFNMVREGNSRVKLTCVKQKDHDEGPPIWFQTRVSGDSIVLVPTIKMDDDYSVDNERIERTIVELLKDDNFESDRARAKALAQACELSEVAAQSRIVRAKQRVEVSH